MNSAANPDEEDSQEGTPQEGIPLKEDSQEGIPQKEDSHTEKDGSDSEEQESYPDEEKCLEILGEVGCSEEVIAHCRAVADLAVEIANLVLEADADLVMAGALLHDMGRARSHEIDHGIIGRQMAEELHLSHPVALIIERHIGAGLTKQEAEELGLPPKGYMPQSVEERIVAHADNLVNETGRRPVSDIVSIMVEEGKLKVARRIINLHNRLSEMCGLELDEL